MPAAFIPPRALAAALAKIQFHHAEVRTLAQATEDEAKVRAALEFVAGAEAPVEREATEGQHGNPIVLFTATIEQTARVRGLVERIAEEEATREMLLRQLEARMDEEGNFYVRLAKQEAFMRRLTVTTSEDAILVRMKVATYPARAEVAREKMRAYLATVGTRKDK